METLKVYNLKLKTVGGSHFRNWNLKIHHKMEGEVLYMKEFKIVLLELNRVNYSLIKKKLREREPQ